MIQKDYISSIVITLLKNVHGVLRSHTEPIYENVDDGDEACIFNFMLHLKIRKLCELACLDSEFLTSRKMVGVVGRSIPKSGMKLRDLSLLHASVGQNLTKQTSLL